MRRRFFACLISVVNTLSKTLNSSTSPSIKKNYTNISSSIHYLKIVYKMRNLEKKTPSQIIFDNVNELLSNMRQDITEPIRVREEELAERLGVSRTPVREALIRLESTGMISLRPGKGALLLPITDEDYIEWLQLREILEGFAAHEATLNASQRDVERLMSIFQPFLDPVSNAKQEDSAYAQANVNFHKEIIALAKNSLLERVWSAFGHRTISHRRKTIQKLHRREDSLKEHMEMIEAIANRDAVLAEKLAREHVRKIHVALLKNAN